jgi:hypothetical protein
MLVPINVKEVKRFLGVVGFYWHYFWNFANKTTPMCKLLRKDEEFKWTEACNKSWEWMKASMTCLLVSMVPNWKIKFHVYIDASNFVLGIMLGQNPNNTIDKPIYMQVDLWIVYKNWKGSFNYDICCEENQTLFVRK